MEEWETMDEHKAIQQIEQSEGVIAECQRAILVKNTRINAENQKIKDAKNYLQMLFEDDGLCEVTHEQIRYVLSTKKGSQSVNIPDASLVPREFMREKLEVDKAKIKVYLKGNQPNWATMKRGDSVFILKAK